MQEQELELHEDDLRDRLLPLLRGRVFHVTSAERLKSIERSRFIRANIDGSLGNTYPQSAASLGRRNGWVCLFDLREKSESAIDWGLDCFYFLAPRPLGDHVAFLMADVETHRRHVLPDDVVRTDGVCIPNLECWFPADMPFECINEVLIVKLRRRAIGPHAALVLSAHGKML